VLYVAGRNFVNPAAARFSRLVKVYDVDLFGVMGAQSLFGKGRAGNRRGAPRGWWCPRRTLV